VTTQRCTKETKSVTDKITEKKHYPAHTKLMTLQ